MNLQWVDKYKPRNLNEVIGNDNIINKIDKWVKVFTNNNLIYTGFKNAILLSGPPGVGKTTIAHLILEKYNFDIIEFNASEIRTSKIISEKLHNILSGRSIKTMYSGDIKTGVIMDEIDGIESRKESNTNDIIKYINYKTNIFKKKNKKNKNVNIKNVVRVNQNPIICICNKINKNVNPLLKELIHIKFKLPNDTLIFKLIQRINNFEKLNIPDSIINFIIPHCQNDFRRTIYILELLSNNKFNNTNNNEILEKIKNLGDKDIDIGVYEAVNNVMFNKKISMQESLNLYNADQNFVPYIIYENFLKFVDKNIRISYKEKLNLSISYYETFIDAQQLRTKIFGNWFFNDYIGILACYTPHILIKNLKFKNNSTQFQFQKSALISKYNYRYYNLKSINIISKKIGIELGEFQFFAYLILTSIFNNTNIQELYMKECKKYNITFKEYEKTMKLCYLYPKYTHLYTKKNQKKLCLLYEKL
jgi:replication factor C subunit 1